MTREDVIWRAWRGTAGVTCSVRRTCAGVELHVTGEGETARCERYGDASTAYERARTLLDRLVAAGYSAGEP